MRKYQRFVSRHPWVSPAFFTVAMAVYACIFADIGLSPWWTLVLLPFLLISFLQNASASSALQQAAIKIMEDTCDPYPLLDETTIQLTYIKNTGLRAYLLLNHAAALIETGEPEKAYGVLSNLSQVDLGPLPQSLLVFYHNLAYAELAVTGDLSRVQVWYEQAVKMVDGIKKPEERVKATAMAQMLYGEWQIARGEYVAALEAVNSVPNNSLRRQVDKAWAYARIAYAQGDIATAIRNLEYVIGYGNRLYVVQQAHALLAEVTAGQNEATK